VSVRSIAKSENESLHMTGQPKNVRVVSKEMDSAVPVGESGSQTLARAAVHPVLIAVQTTNAFNGASRRDLPGNGHGQRLFVVQQQRRQRLPGAKRVTAGHAAAGMDGAARHPPETAALDAGRDVFACGPDRGLG